MARMATLGFADLSPDVMARVEGWVGHSFEIVAFLGYAIIHPWLQKKLGKRDLEQKAA